MMTELDKSGRVIRTPHDISQNALGLLTYYCVTYPEELPCLLVDIFLKTELGKTEISCKTFYENWSEGIKSWNVEDRASIYFLIEPDETESLLLKDRLRLNDDILEKCFDIMNNAVQEISAELKSEKIQFFELTKKSEEFLLEIRVLTYVCRRSPVKVEDLLKIYAVNKSWMTLKIRKWKMERIISTKNKPLTLIKRKGLKTHLLPHVKPDLVDTHYIIRNGETFQLSEQVINYYKQLDEIVRNEGK